MTTLTLGQYAPLLLRSSAAPHSTMPHPQDGVFLRRDLRHGADYFANLESIQKLRDRKDAIARNDADEEFKLREKENAEATHLKNDKLLKAEVQRTLKIFDVPQLKIAKEYINKGPSDVREQNTKVINDALKNNGLRLMPTFKGIGKKLAGMKSQFPNFEAFIDNLEIELTIAGQSDPDDFRVTPVLLDGAPGIGKTKLSNELAKALGIPILALSAVSLQGGFSLFGTAAHWSNTQPGSIFKLLSRNDSAVAILLLDEMDKISRDDRHGVLPALLALLEPETAKHVRDDALEINFDASRLIVIGTSNDISEMNPALLSRLSVFKVAEPDAGQKIDIAKQLHNRLCKSAKKKVLIEKGAVEALAESDMDLRELTRIVRTAFGYALINKTRSRPQRAAAIHKKANIGFIRSPQ